MMDCAKANVIASICAITALSYAGCASQATADAPQSPASVTEAQDTPLETAAEPDAPPDTTPAAEPDLQESAMAAEDDSVERDASETRTTEAIAEIVKNNRDQARACYEKVQKDIPKLKGDLVIHFVLNPDGSVKLAELNEDRSTLKEPALVSCVVDVIRSLKFPESSRGMETKVNYPFNFNP